MRFLALAFFAVGFLNASEMRPLEGSTQIISALTEFVLGISKGDIAGSFESFSEITPIPPSQLAILAAGVANSRPEITGKYGKSRGVQPIGGVEEIDGVIARYVLLEKFTNNGLLWVFTFYKHEKGWVCVAFSTDKIESAWNYVEKSNGGAPAEVGHKRNESP